MRYLLSIAFTLACSAAPPAVAQSLAQQRAYCEDQTSAYPPELQIAGCTAIIQSDLTLSPSTRAIVFRNRGASYHDQGDAIRAMADYDEAIRLNPKYASAFNNRGAIHFEQGDYTRAVVEFDEAIRIDPQFALAFSNRGAAYHEGGDSQRAIADHDRAIQLDPQHARAFYNRGLAYSTLGNFDRAIADFDQAIRLNPNHAAAFNDRGSVYYEQRDYALAIADFDEAIRLDPQFALPFNNRGLAHLDLETSARPSPTLIKRSASMETMRTPFATGASLMTARAILRGPLQTMTLQSGSIRDTPQRLPTAAWRM